MNKGDDVARRRLSGNDYFPRSSTLRAFSTTNINAPPRPKKEDFATLPGTLARDNFMLQVDFMIVQAIRQNFDAGCDETQPV
jgi:hypothetical protein